MWRRICSERNILICLYLTIFLLPLSSWLFTLPLFRRHCFLWGIYSSRSGRSIMAASGDGLAGAFNLFFLSVFNAPDKFFSILTGAFCPWRMRFFMCLSLHTLRERRERGKRFMSFGGCRLRCHLGIYTVCRCGMHGERPECRRMGGS